MKGHKSAKRIHLPSAVGQRVGDVLHYFYEMARPDLAPELRTVKVPIDGA